MDSSKGKSTGKKLLNSVDGCVDDFLLGFVSANNSLRLVSEHRIVVRADFESVLQRGLVTVVCGGGSGHEPAFAGYVGEGMLTAAVAGPVFASPPVNNILNAIRLVGYKTQHNGGGTLVVVPNYTGDKLNYGLAIERAKSEGYRVESVLVGDDCALISSDRTAGRRALSGLMITIKVAGAMAEEGKRLDQMMPLLQRLTSNLGTIGLCLHECSIPGCSPSFVLAEDEMELGLGAHGEAGVTRIKLTSAKETVDVMLSHMTNPVSNSSLILKPEEKVVLLVNNLGATTTLEMGIVTREAIDWLESRGVEIVRVFVGHVMTSLEMAGVAFTILKDAQVFLPFLDAGTSATSWPKQQQRLMSDQRRRLSKVLLAAPNYTPPTLHQDCFTISTDEQKLMTLCIERVCQELIKSKEALNQLDRVCGDGDCGNTLSSGAQAVLLALTANELNLGLPYHLLQQLSFICQQTMGGASGAIFGIFLSAASHPLKGRQLSVELWVDAISAGASAVSKHAGAQPGDRTLLDSLDEVLLKLRGGESSGGEWSGREAARVAAAAATSGAESTRGMRARAGRASYLNENNWTSVDPGAQAVAIIATAISHCFD